MKQYELRTIIRVDATDGCEAREIVQGLQSLEPRIVSIRFKGYDYLRRACSNPEKTENDNG